MTRGILTLAREGYGVEDIRAITGKCYADIALTLGDAVCRGYPQLHGLLRIADARATEEARRAA